MARLKTLLTGTAIIVCVFCFNAHASGVSDLKSDFIRANDLYKDSQYAQAIVIYEAILKSGYASGNLYYNLGNCYFKKNELGRAMLNYERALVFIPGDSDLRSNYDYLRSTLNLGAKDSAGGRGALWLDRISQAFTIDGLTLFLALLFWIIFFGIAVAMFYPRFRMVLKPWLIGLGVLFLCGGGILFRNIDQFNQAAIVVSKEAEVKFEPAQSATTYFKLTEGEKLQVLELSGGWLKIKRLDGKIGWMADAALERVNQ